VAGSGLRPRSAPCWHALKARLRLDEIASVKLVFWHRMARRNKDNQEVAIIRHWTGIVQWCHL